MAQLVAHLLCKQGVRGSSPLGSTQMARGAHPGGGWAPLVVRASVGRGVRPRRLRLRGGGPARRLLRGGTRARGPGGGRSRCPRGAAAPRRRRLRDRCAGGLDVGLRGGLTNLLGDLRRALLHGGGRVGGLLADPVSYTHLTL